MAEDGDTDDKPYEASQKKLEDARKKGNIPRSTDLNTTAAYAGLLLVGLIAGGAVLMDFGQMLGGYFSGRLWKMAIASGGRTGPLLAGPVAMTVGAILPLFAGSFVLVLLSVIAQRSVVFYGGNLEPKLSRLSVLENFKKRFGRRGLFEFFKSFVKLLLYMTALVLFLRSREAELLQSVMLEANQVTLTLFDLTLGFMWVSLVIAAAIGVIDYLFQRAEHMRSMRMSHREMMDELKNFEGDPALKQKRRQRGMEIARSQMLRDVRTADVVVVNPEHYAVALKWSRERGTAPVCVAKGVDEIAATIRTLAREHDVPIYREPPTARAIYATVEIGQEVQPDHYRAVAAAIRFAEAMRQKRRHSPYGA